MKRKFLPFLLAATVLIGGLSSCYRGKEISVTFDNIVIDRQVPISNDPKAPQCLVHIQFVFCNDTNKKAADAINRTIISKAFALTQLTPQQAVDSFTNHYINMYKQNLHALYQADKGGKNISKGWYDYNYVLTTFTQKGSFNVVEYIMQLETYEGGVHSLNTQQILNFDTRTGKLLTLNNIFVPGYEQSLNDILLKALEDKTSCKDIKELRSKGYLVSNEIFAPDNFLFNDGNITFVYNPYEIAPYSVGSIELTISDSDMKNILKYYPK